MANPAGWGGRLKNLLNSAEEQILGFGELAADRGADDAGNAAADEHHGYRRLSGFLGSSNGSAPSAPLSELEERLSSFLVRMDSRKAISEKWFGADAAMHRLFDVLILRSRELSRVSLRGSEVRCTLANQMLAPEVTLREAPRYSIHFEQYPGKDIVYLKRLYSGWCVNVDRATFEKLAYGGDLPEKAYENLHTLVARGPVLQKGVFPPTVRTSVWVACDDATHLSRTETYKERKREVAQHQEEQSCRMGLVSTLPEAPEVAHVTNAPLLELEVIFAADASSGQAVEDSKITRTCSDMAVEDCVSHVLDAAAQNLDRLARAFEEALVTASFTEKLEYWSALKTSDATSQKLLSNLFNAALGSGSAGSSPAGFEGARELCEQYRKEYPQLPTDEVAQKLVKWQASLNVSTGFVTGFGGFLTMPITIPTGLIATWVTSARLAFAVAHVYGHDIFHPCVADAVLWCLTGSAEADGDRSPEESVRARLEACKQKRFAKRADDTAEEACLQLELRDDVLEDAANPAEEDHTHELTNYDPSSKEFQEKYTTLYDLLGVDQTASQQEIRVAYRRLALRYHPDKLGSSDPEEIRVATEKFQVLGAAYEELGDPVRRKAYDVTLQQGKWSWSDFSWSAYGMERAREAFTAAKRAAAEAFQPKQPNLSAQVTTRAVTQGVVDILEATTVSTLARAGGQVELRSSILAGEKLAASATARSSTSLIPILGALVCGAIDGATTASVGRAAMRIFKA